jgi:Reverse transcriptase (RNA-dependent DNA polymerase)
VSLAKDLSARAVDRPPDALTFFQYPNFKPDKPDNLRQMAILSAPDLALLRAEAGAIIKVTDALLSDNVCSYRLNRPPIRGVAWGFEPRNSWKNRFLAGGIEILDKAEFPFMCRTDISKYYPSIQIDFLQQALLTNGCDARAVARIFAILKFWQDFCRLDGLPIGPEASAVFSNFFLRPIDSLIATTGAQYKRYGDDMLIFSRNRSMGEAVAESLDDELRFLQLTRSIEKTEFFDDPADARANLEDAEIDYMEGATNYYPDLGLYTIKRSFRRILQTATNDLRVSRLRWLLKYLTNHYERDGCLEISQRTDLMNIDPKIATNYLAVAKSDQRVLANCMQRLTQPREERFDGLTLHQLRLMSQAKTGRPEAKEFERIARDQSTPWPTRSWAWAALARADGTKASRLMEAAREEAEPNIRRAIVATLKRHSHLWQCRKFLRDEVKNCPSNKYTVEWVKQAG